MKRLFFLLPALAITASLAVTVPASASGETASGTLAVTATIQPSISLAFVSDGSGVTLGGTATHATLAFGSISRYGSCATAGVTCAAYDTNSWKASSPFDIDVEIANSSSTTYALTAALDANDMNSVVWTVDGVTLSTSAATVTATHAYGTLAHSLVLQIPYADTTGITNTITFVATAT